MKRLVVIVAALLAVSGIAAGLYFSGIVSPGTEATGADAADTPTAVELASETGEDESDDEESSVPVNVVKVTVGSVSTYLTSTANLVPEDEVTVLAEAEGRVTQLLVEEGDRVSCGQLLVTLLRDEAEIAHNKSRLKSANAELAFERARRMLGDDLIAREEYDRVTMDHRIAEQELAEAKWELDKTEIRAPFDGRVTRRSVTLGQHIREGDELFVVTNFDPLIARIYLPEKDVIALEEGRHVDITLKADEEVRFQGRIRQISPVVDTATGTVKVTVEAIAPPAAVRPGGFVIIDIVRETHADALVLPREAVIRELATAHVFVANDGVAEKRSVDLGLEEGESLEILSGVAAGEQIVVAGQGGLKDGEKIKILAADPDATASEVSRRTRLQAHG